MESNIERPKNCGECERFKPDMTDPKIGYCDEWPCILTPDCICHPNIGRKRKVKVQK